MLQRPRGTSMPEPLLIQPLVVERAQVALALTNQLGALHTGQNTRKVLATALVTRKSDVLKMGAIWKWEQEYDVSKRSVGMGRMSYRQSRKWIKRAWILKGAANHWVCV